MVCKTSAKMFVRKAYSYPLLLGCLWEIKSQKAKLEAEVPYKLSVGCF